MVQKLPYLKETPSQTAGPFVHIGLAPSVAGLGESVAGLGRVIAGPGTKGERIRVEGRVLDGTGAPVKDVLIEVWQANSQGRYNHPEDRREMELEPDFRGWGRVVADLATGVFGFETIKPGPVPARGGGSQAPHLSLWLVARGINIGLATRMYFGDEEAANAADPLLSRIESPARRRTLIAPRDPGAPLYRFDIRLQGEDETVFLDI